MRTWCCSPLRPLIQGRTSHSEALLLLQRSCRQAAHLLGGRPPTVYAAPSRTPKAVIPFRLITSRRWPYPHTGLHHTHTHALALGPWGLCPACLPGKGTRSPHYTLINIRSSEKWKPLLTLPQPVGTEGILCEGDYSSWCAQNFLV